jgi:hypothetical protein
MIFEKVSYGGWSNCYRLSNDVLELIITGDVGPRIIRFGFVGGDNEFAENTEILGQTGGDTWRNYGGHRFWHAPEVQPRTYSPDNSPVTVEQRGETIHLIQPTEADNRVHKELEIRFEGEGVHVLHRLINHNPWSIEAAPWAISVMAKEGKAIIPLAPRGSHAENLQPKGSLITWAYTDMTDPRWQWGREYIMLRQDPSATNSQKVGATLTEGWAAYARGGNLFVKTVQYQTGATYPDMGSSGEFYTDARILEVETLGPLSKVEPEGSAEHLEHWYLFRDVPMPQSEADITQNVLPKVRSIKT